MPSQISKGETKLAGKKKYWAVVQNIGFGTLIALGGNIIWKTGWDSKHEMPVYKWAGLPLAGTGLLFIGYGIYLLFKIPKAQEPSETDFICPNCESVYSLVETEKHICPNDGATMELLEGYYKRHPERKNAPITPNMD